MKHHSQVFIALFLLILLIISPQEGYTNKQTRISDIFSDNSGNIDNSGSTIISGNYNNKWLDSDNGGSSTEFKFSENYNYKFKNPISDVGINTPTIIKPDFKIYNRYWPIDDKK